jgi:hypothetical protein
MLPCGAAALLGHENSAVAAQDLLEKRTAKLPTMEDLTGEEKAVATTNISVEPEVEDDGSLDISPIK